jgi:GT2 family glycosyltransferase
VTGESSATGTPTIAVVVLTHDRADLLRKCVEDVLLRTSSWTTEIVIWNNASTDRTREYLDALTDPRIRVVHSGSNIGQNGYARAFAQTSAEYLVELDDDVVDAPPGWDRVLADAYRRLPTIGFLAADLEDDPYDVAAEYRYRVRPHEYSSDEVNGVALLRGPTGGGCAMTDRALYDSVGGFRESTKHVFWQEEAAYIADIRDRGFEPAILADLKVLHTGGPHYAPLSEAKTKYWDHWNRTRARKAALKRALLMLPLVRPLNARFSWFSEPEPVNVARRSV